MIDGNRWWCSGPSGDDDDSVDDDDGIDPWIGDDDDEYVGGAVASGEPGQCFFEVTHLGSNKGRLGGQAEVLYEGERGRFKRTSLGIPPSAQPPYYVLLLVVLIALKSLAMTLRSLHLLWTVLMTLLYNCLWVICDSVIAPLLIFG